MEEKELIVYKDGEPILRMIVNQEDSIEGIFKYFTDNYPNYDVTIFLDEQTIIDANYDQDFYEKIYNGKILLKSYHHGKIRIGQQQRAKSYPSFSNYEIIPAWSRGAGIWKNLSPFYLKFSNGVIFENFYQSYKVWKQVDKQSKPEWKYPSEIHVDNNENPNEKWFKWHSTLKHHKSPVRRPNGKNIPLYSYWKGRKLGVVEARKEIYIPYLKKLYRESDTYKKLLQKVRSGTNIMIVEPDGPLLEAYPNGLEVDLNLLNELIDVTNYGPEGFPHKYRPYGHGYVLAATLLEDL